MTILTVVAVPQMSTIRSSVRGTPLRDPFNQAAWGPNNISEWSNLDKTHGVSADRNEETVYGVKFRKAFTSNAITSPKYPTAGPYRENNYGAYRCPKH